MPVDTYQTLACRLIETANGVVYGSDMRLITNHAKLAVMRCGDVNMTHAAIEFVRIEEMLTMTKVMVNLIAQ